MKRIIYPLLLVFLASLGYQSQAQVLVTVGNGTSTTATYSTGQTPFGTYYHDDRTQMLFTASEIIAAGGFAGSIVNLAFNVSSAASQPMNGFNVEIGTTTATSITSMQGGLTNVYTATSHTATNGWNEFTFNTPFTWNGTDNIIVNVCFDNTSYTSNSLVYYTSTSFTSVYSRYADSWAGAGCQMSTSGGLYNGNERANIRFGFLPPVANDAGVQAILSPSLPTCDLDSIDIELVLNNFGSDTLTNCSVHYKVGTSAVVSQLYTGTVPPLGGTDTVVIATENFSNLDDLLVYTTMPNGIQDSLSSNDSLMMTVATGLTGTFSIPNDYATINDAVSDLEEFGVCDSVIFNIAAGTYNEQVIFGDIVGTSEDATVTFQSATGNVNDVTITHAGNSSTSGFVIDFAGGDWITFRDVKIQNTGSYYGQVVSISGQSDNITVEDCWLKGIGGTSTTYQSLINISGTPNNTTFQGNTLEKGSCWFYSTSGSTTTKKENLVMEDNLMKDQSYYGSYIYYWDGVEFHGNTIKNDSAFQYSTGYYAMGRWYYVDNFNVTNNYVGATAGNGWYYGMYMYSCVGSSNPRSVMANNCIITGNNNSSAYYALYMSQSGLVDIYNNSFTRAGTNSSYAGYIYQGGAINLKNNNFINYGSNWALYVNGGFTVNESDHNNYYNTGGALVYMGNTSYNTLEDLQNGTGQDMNSVSVDPAWVDLMACITCNDTVADAGTPVGSVTEDILGNTRSTVNPDIGAVEFVNANSFDLGANDTVCGNEILLEAGPAQSVAWGVSENGGATQSYTTSAITLAASGNEPSDFEVDVIIATEFCGNATDAVTLRLVPDADLDSSAHICADEDLTLVPGGGSGATYMWSTGATTSTIDVEGSGSYSVVKMEEGCESEATISVTQSTAVELSDVEGCADDAPITVDASIPNGNSYAWSGGNAANAAANNFDDEGVYTVTATDAFGCVSETEFELFILGDPKADIDYTGSAGTAYLFSSAGSDEIGPNTDYLWTFNSIDTSTQANPTYIFPWNGTPTTYPVTLEVDNGCETDIASLNLVVDPLGVAELKAATFQVYPNPTNGNVFITAKDGWKDLNVTIMDNAGRVVMTEAFTGAQMVELNVAHLAAGSYLIQLSDNELNETQTLIIQ